MNEDCSAISDVYIENGKIIEVGPNLRVPAGARVIDAADKLVMPGGIDTHTHMELAFMGVEAVDDFHIGTKVEEVFFFVVQPENCVETEKTSCVPDAFTDAQWEDGRCEVASTSTPA